MHVLFLVVALIISSNLYSNDSIKITIEVYSEVAIKPDYISLEISFSENNSNCNEEIGATDIYSQFEIFKNNVKFIEQRKILKLDLLENFNQNNNTNTYSIHPIQLEDLESIYKSAKMAFGHDVKLFSWINFTSDKEKNAILNRTIKKGEEALKIFKSIFNKKHHVLQDLYLDEDGISVDQGYLNEDIFKAKSQNYYKVEISRFEESEAQYEFEIELEYMIF